MTDLDTLNSEQREAVLDFSHNLLLLACAGSGKTRTITSKIAYAIENGIYKPWQILAVTFTNKATEEMKTRILSQLYGIWKQLDDSRSYTEAICAGLDASPAFVSRQAGLALRLLLHNYTPLSRAWGLTTNCCNG